jgi:hypothetical protein
MMWQELRVAKRAVLASPFGFSAGDEHEHDNARIAYIARKANPVSPSDCKKDDTSNKMPCVETSPLGNVDVAVVSAFCHMRSKVEKSLTNMPVYIV